MNKERVYLAHSAAFTTIPYNIPAIKSLVKENGGQNIRTALQFGWSNQPKVVTWANHTKQIAQAIENWMQKYSRNISPIIFIKDWR